MAIVAGFDGDEAVSTAVAVRIADSLLTAEQDAPGGRLLAEHTVYIIPRANPDAVESFFATPRFEQRFALRPWDDDRDGLIDEDGPEDLNGDGLITMMRVPLEGRWIDKLEATHLPDPLEPRLLKEADRAKGEKPLYAIFAEGVDDDGDEAFNEDGPGGVDVNRNFLHNHKEHDPGTGPHAISEPESKALIDFFFEHPRIAIAVFYGRHDNLVEEQKPEGRGKKPPEAEAAPARTSRMGFRMHWPPRPRKAPKDLHKGDIAIYKQIGEKYREITGLKKVHTEASDGALFAWAYAQYGIPSFACRVWPRPEPEEKKKEGDEGEEDASDAGEDGETKDTDAPDAAIPEEPHDDTGEQAASKDKSNDQGERKRRGRPGKKDAEEKKGPADKEAVAWLKYSDEKRDGAGFIPWTPFDHPQLGTVEIGGFVPFFRTTPPADQLEDIAEKQLAFVLDLAGRFPKVSLADPKVTRLSDTVYEIETALINEGYFPSGLAIAEDNRRVRPVVVTVDLPLERILGGGRVERIWSVPGSGGCHKLRWVVLGQPDSSVTINVTSEKYGDTRLDVTLTPTSKKERGES